MKHGWETKKLGEVLVKTETVDPTKNPDTEFAYLDVSSVNKETKEIESATVLLGKDAPSRARKLVRANDVIFATVRPTHSRVALIPLEYDKQVCSTGYFVLRGKEFICNKFLFYFLLTDEFNKTMEKLQKGANYPAVTDTEIKNINLTFPKSLPEQQRIVAILDECFAAIAKAKANAEQNLRNAKELFESYLQSIFENKGEGWEEKALGEICIIERGSSPRPIEKYVTNDENGVNWIKIGDTKGIDKYLYKTREKITKEGAQKSRFVRKGDFILSNSMSFGKPYIMKTEGYIHDGWFVLRLPKYIDTEFFWYLLTSSFIKNQFTFLAAGAIVKNISSDLVKKTVLPIPPLKEQQAIVQKLDALSVQTKKLEAIYQQKINDLEELKKSILQKAFRGELKTTKEVAV